MCNGHRFVKSTLFQSPGYLADLSPYINAVISSRLLATPINLTTSAIKPLAPLAQSILPARATNFILNGTLTCEYCLHQVSQDKFDDGRSCPSLLLDLLSVSNDSDFVLADQLIESQDRVRVEKEQALAREIELSTRDSSKSSEIDDINDTTQQPSTSTSQSGTNINLDKNKSRKSPESPKVDDYSGDDDDCKYKRQRKLNEAHLYKNVLLITQICPEIGLHAQAFKCVDCDKDIDLNSSRLCHYDGRYYCYQCHSGYDLLPIPARVLRNWDFTPKPVSRTSLQKICYLRTKPVLFNLFQLNSMLYGFIDRLVEIKQTRERIQSMLKYLEVCGQPNRPYLIPVPKHFLNKDLLNFFSLNDLFDINQVHDLLSQLQSTLETHIVRKCESCRGKGYYCELCKDPHDILYPFSRNGAACTNCHAVYHKNCFHRKKKNCPRCLRLSSKRRSSSSTSFVSRMTAANEQSLEDLDLSANSDSTDTTDTTLNRTVQSDDTS